MIAKRLSICLLPVAAFLIAPSATSAMSRPCGWLTADEASTAAGVKVTETVDRKTLNGSFNGCQYRTSSISRFVLIEAYARPSVADAQQFFDQQLKAAARLPGAYGQTHSLPITAVQGIGDQADDVAAQLFVRKGAVIFAVSIATPLDESQTPAFAQKRKTLAQAIVRRI